VTSLPLCRDEIMQKIERHALSDTRREVGGILVGAETNGLIEVRAALPALKATAEATHVTFTHEVWEDVLNQVDRQHPDCQIVGWYHSHPGFGIFLSEYDKFAHANFFSGERMLALVVDPVGGQSGWFGWVDGTVQILKTFPMLNAPATAGTAGRGSPSEAVGGGWAGRHGRAVLLAALAAVASLGVGYGVGAAGGSSKPAKPAQAQVANGAVEGQLADAQRENDRLRHELGDASAAVSPNNPGNPAATPPVGGGTVFMYTVRPGDTLWAMAEFLYGDGARYVDIARENPGLDPAQLAVGSQVGIRLPQSQLRAS